MELKQHGCQLEGNQSNDDPACIIPKDVFLEPRPSTPFPPSCFVIQDLLWNAGVVCPFGTSLGIGLNSPWHRQVICSDKSC